jgi:hypothetical protein
MFSCTGLPVSSSSSARSRYMDRYADRLDSAADQAGKAKISPDEPDLDEDGKGPSS